MSTLPRLIQAPRRKSSHSNPKTYFLYIDPVMLHEFGHTLGLPDYYADPTMDNLNAVMNGGGGITTEDIEQLRAIYLLHSKH